MKIVYNGENDTRTFKDVIPATIAAIAAEDPDYIYLDADLMNCIGTVKFAQANPDKGIDCGIAEANMVGVAGGLAAVGFKPIVHSFGTFSSRRCFDQAFLSGGYAKNPITILGSDPGVTAALNGGTHMPFEDVALYRALPEATVIDITDPTMMIDMLWKEMCIRDRLYPTSRQYGRNGTCAVALFAGVLLMPLTHILIG